MMKTLLKIVFIGVMTVLLGMAAATAKEKDPSVTTSSKSKSLYTIKANKKFVGAQVEIIQADGNVISKQILAKRKMIIDFDDVRLGAYKIRISKGNQTREYVYEKK